MQLSVDGFVAGPHGEMDWMVWDWDDELKQHVGALTKTVDCMLLGRHLAEGFIPAWESRLTDPNPETAEAARIMCDTPKVVFSHTLKSINGNNTTLATSSLVEEVTKLKNQSGNDIMVYGGATLVANMLHHDLIDELNLFINPTALGGGMAIFRERINLQLVQAKPFACGIVALTYNLSK